MKFCVDLTFLQKIESQDLLTYLALLLAYLAYVWSINRDLNTWYSLFLSFKDELKIFEYWLGGKGYESLKEYSNKNSYSPYNNIFPLVSVALPEIIRRGAKEFEWIPKEFSSHLSLFNSRVDAFNSFLDQIKLVCSADPVLSEQLYNKLGEFGLNDDDVSFETFKQRIKKMQENKDEQRMGHLAEYIRRLNATLHVSLISNKSKADMLHSLLAVIQEENDFIIRQFNDKRHWFIRWQAPIVFASIGFFIFIELTLI